MADEPVQSTSDGTQNPSNTNGSSADGSQRPQWFSDYLKEEENKRSAAQQQTQSQQQNSGSSGTTVAQALMDKLEALPEQIAKFINEANPKPAQSPSDSGNNAGSGTGSEGKTPGAPQGKTRQQRFTDWWFNG